MLEAAMFSKCAIVLLMKDINFLMETVLMDCSARFTHCRLEVPSLLATWQPRAVRRRNRDVAVRLKFGYLRLKSQRSFVIDLAISQAPLHQHPHHVGRCGGGGASGGTFTSPCTARLLVGGQGQAQNELIR